MQYLLFTFYKDLFTILWRNFKRNIYSKIYEKLQNYQNIYKPTTMQYFFTIL